MNQYLKILLFGLLVFGGCEDEPDDFEVSKVPSTFTKKVLIEELQEHGVDIVLMGHIELKILLMIMTVELLE